MTNPRPLRWTLLLALTLGIAGCAGDDPAETAAPIVDLLPSTAELAGWTVADGPVEYSPDTLYEYLDGGAERYVDSGFERLVHIRYRLGDDPLACVTLDVYDMGGELGAFGIYSAAKPPDAVPRPWGAEGYREGTIAAAYRGSVYVHGEADDDRAELLTMLEQLTSGVADKASGAAAPPTILEPLPVAHRVPGSERYVPSNLLGHAFLPGGVLATYEIGDRRSVLFFSDLGSEAKAVEALAALDAHFAQRGADAAGAPPFGDGGFRLSSPVFGRGSVVREGALIAGIQGDLSFEEGEGILRRLITGDG